LNWSGFQVGPGEDARVFHQTLERDLVRSGWFTLARSGPGEYTMTGSCVEQGGHLAVECSVYGVADQRRRFGQRYRQPGVDVRLLAHRVADDIVEALTGRKGIASSRIAMVGSRSGRKELYICDADGGRLTQLTQDRSVSVAPKWGPAGKKLIYTAYLKRFPDLFMIDLASGRRTCIANFPGLNTGGAISPNGREVALILSKDGNPELYVMRIGGGNPTRLTRTLQAAEASPSWSPDGKRIVFVSDRSGRPQLYIVGRSGGEPKRVSGRGSENVAPDWGNNGLIAYSSRTGGRYELAVMDPERGVVQEVVQDGADYEDPSWAPDGRHIACTRTANHRAKVYILDTLGDPPVALSDFDGEWFTPAWCPQ
jgi:TolB protein